MGKKETSRTKCKKAGQPELFVPLERLFFGRDEEHLKDSEKKKPCDLIYILKNDFCRWVGNIRQGKKQGNQVGNKVSNPGER